MNPETQRGLLIDDDDALDPELEPGMLDEDQDDDYDDEDDNA